MYVYNQYMPVQALQAYCRVDEAKLELDKRVMTFQVQYASTNLKHRPISLQSP